MSGLTGDTRVILWDGSKPTMLGLIEQFGIGRIGPQSSGVFQFRVLTVYDETLSLTVGAQVRSGFVSAGLAADPKRLRPNVPIVEVLIQTSHFENVNDGNDLGFDNLGLATDDEGNPIQLENPAPGGFLTNDRGRTVAEGFARRSVIRCSPKQLFMRLDGAWRTADALVPGDRLMPIATDLIPELQFLNQGHTIEIIPDVQVVSVKLAGTADVYSFFVERSHNFGLAAGVVVAGL